MVVTDVYTNLLRVQEIEERFQSYLLSVGDEDIEALFRPDMAQKRRRDELQRTVELMRRAKLRLGEFACY